MKTLLGLLSVLGVFTVYGSAANTSSLVFNGTSSYCSVDELANTRFHQGPTTVSFWVKASSSAQEEAYGTIFSVVQRSFFHAPVQKFVIEIVKDGTNAGKLRVREDEYDVVYMSSAVIGDDQFHYVALVWDAPDNCIVYIDGEEDGTYIPESFSISNCKCQLGSNITIESTWSSLFSTKHNNLLKGQLDELCIWKRSLSHDEVLWLAHRNPNTLNDDIISYWPMDEGTGISMYPAAGEGIKGTLYNCSWSSDYLVSVRGQEVVHAAPNNILPNSFFDETTILWEPGDNVVSVSTDQTDALVGGASMRIDWSEGDDPGEAYYLILKGDRGFEDVASGDIRLSGWFKCANASAGAVAEVQVGINDEAVATAVTVTNNEWQRISVDHAFTTAPTVIKVSLFCEDNDVLCDDIMFGPVPEYKKEQSISFANGGNFIRQWSFEDDSEVPGNSASDWSAFGSFSTSEMAYDEDVVFHGYRSLKISSTTAKTGGVEYVLTSAKREHELQIAAIKGQSAVFSCYVYSPSNVNVRLGVNSDWSETITVPAGRWYRCCKDIEEIQTLYGSGGSENVALDIEGVNAEEFYVDGVVLELTCENIPAEPVSQTTFFDLNGNNLQTQKRYGPDSVITSAMTFDVFNRPVYISKEFRCAVTGNELVADPWGCGGGYYTARNEPRIGAMFYSKNVYEDGPLCRIAREFIPGTDFSDIPIEYEYTKETINWPAIRQGNVSVLSYDDYSVLKTTQLDGTIDTKTYDKAGRLVKTVNDIEGTAYSTVYEHDELGRIRCVYPNIYLQNLDASYIDTLISEYIYDGRGLLTNIEVPDMDDTDDPSENEINVKSNADVSYKYMTNGALRMSHNAAQKRASFTGGHGFRATVFDYDDLGRKIKEKTIDDVSISFGGFDANYDPASGEYLGATTHVEIAYDRLPDIGIAPWSTCSGLPDISVEFARGRVVGEAFMISGNPQVYGFNFYEYDKQGRILKKVIQFPSSNVPQNTIAYEYGYAGNLVGVSHSGSGLEIHYSYDEYGRLSTVGYTPDDIICKYEYDCLGQLNAILYYTDDGVMHERVDYTRDHAGRASRISASSGDGSTVHYDQHLTFDEFGMLTDAEYDYAASPSGNGVHYKYSFTYNRNEMLTDAVYDELQDGVWTGNPANAYGLTGYQYHENGSIAQFSRMNAAGSATQLTYTLYSGRNMTKNTDGTGVPALFYDANGNMVANTNKGIGNGGADGILFDYRDMPREFRVSDDDGTVHSVHMMYDASKNRIGKVIETGAGD